MVGYIIVFMAGVTFGVVSMAALAYGSKMRLYRENFVLTKRVEFLEKDDQRRKYRPVKDPRPNVHNLVN